jgi:hypothetical protein
VISPLRVARCLAELPLTVALMPKLPEHARLSP